MVDYNFDKLRKLEDGWDSYDAPKPTESSISKSSEIIGHLISLDFSPVRVMASADGGVAIIFNGIGIRRALIEVLNGGEITTLLYDMEGNSHITEWFNTSEEETKKAVKLITDWMKY